MIIKIEESSELKASIRDLVKGELVHMVRDEVNTLVKQEIVKQVKKLETSITQEKCDDIIKNKIYTVVLDLITGGRWFSPNNIVVDEAKAVTRELTKEKVTELLEKTKISAAAIKREVVKKLSDKLGV